jgi:hypothetical protein
MTAAQVRLLFSIAGLYDLIAGFVFLFLGSQLFEAAKIPPPNHWAYIQFGALLLIIFGAMFLVVARKPAENRNLMPFGMLLKLAYGGLVAYYWITTDCPLLFKPFAIVDAAMLVLFVIAYRSRLAPR